MNKTEFANRTDRLLGGKNRLTLALAAVVTLIAVGAAGLILASNAERMREDIMRSNFVASLTTQAERADVAQLFADSENSRLLMRYIDSMAGVVENMELSPGWSLSRFTGLLDAAKVSGVEITDFKCSQSGGMIVAECQLLEDHKSELSREEREAAANAAAESFVKAAAASEAFADVRLGKPPEGGGKFQVDCSFT